MLGSYCTLQRKDYFNILYCTLYIKENRECHKISFLIRLVDDRSLKKKLLSGTMYIKEPLTGKNIYFFLRPATLWFDGGGGTGGYWTLVRKPNAKDNFGCL